MNKQIENKISSREVAEMMEINHCDLLEKVTKINKDLAERKIPFSKYWEESTYKPNSNSRSYRELLITKRGCEFLAHKTTGTKGNLFTDKYMDRFAEMESQLTNPMENFNLANQMLNLAQGTQVIGQVVQGVLGTVNQLQVFVQDSIQAKDKQIDDIAEMIGFKAKNTKTLTDKLKIVLQAKYNMNSVNSNMEVYKKAKRQIFSEYNVSKWEDIPATKYNSVSAFIEEAL